MLASPECSWAPNFAMNGALSGLVSITAGCAVFDMWAALLVGVIGGVVYLFSISFCIYTLRIDDPLEAVAVHGFVGLWGLLAVGWFAEPGRVKEMYGDMFIDGKEHSDAVGILYGGNGMLLASQILEVLFVAGWVILTAGPFFYCFRARNWLRVSAEEEHVGVDQGRHGSSAYPEATSQSSSSPPGNDSVHHYGTWNKYADESVVERTPTGQIIIPGDLQGEVDNGNEEEDDDDTSKDNNDHQSSNGYDRDGGVGKNGLQMNTIIEEEDELYVGLDIEKDDDGVNSDMHSQADENDWESVALSRKASRVTSNDHGAAEQLVET
jgi:hypothetical protein